MRKEGSFLKKEPKNFCPFTAGPPNWRPHETDKSLFASFSSEKEDSS
jgi:hypothetical protein